MSNQPTTIPIDIVSDVVCPWCIIGFKRLQNAMDRVEGRVSFDLRWHPFELNPNMPVEGQNLREHLSQKYGTSLEQSRVARERLTQLGKTLGFEFYYYDDMRIHNTFKAHQLLHWAGEQGRQTELKLALFDAYFARQENPDALQVLGDAAARAGLDKQEAEAVIGDGRYTDIVREIEQQWLTMGIRGVPAFVINRAYLILGAQDPAVFVDFFSKILSEEAA